MKIAVLLGFILVNFSVADCTEIVNSFLRESGMKKIHLKIRLWTKIERRIESSSLKDKHEAKKCILPLNPKYPFNDKV